MSREPADERTRLLRELENSRQQLTGELSNLGQAVDVRERIQASVRRHPVWWMAGGLAGGIVLANLLWPARHRSRDSKNGDGAVAAVKSSAILGLLGVAGKQILRLSEPALKRYAQQEIERWVDSRSSATPTNSKFSPRKPAP